MATVSHELTTPLNAVLGMGELLQDSLLNTEMFVEQILKSGERLLQTVNNALDIVSLDSGTSNSRSKNFQYLILSVAAAPLLQRLIKNLRRLNLKVRMI